LITSIRPLRAEHRDRIGAVARQADHVVAAGAGGGEGVAAAAAVDHHAVADAQVVDDHLRAQRVDHRRAVARHREGERVVARG
jgi:hypothetical protein